MIAGNMPEPPTGAGVGSGEKFTALDRFVPTRQFQYVDVTFPATPNADCIIPHRLRPPSPEAVNYQVVRANGATQVYHDSSGTRRAWGTTYLILRSSAASTTVRLLLTVEPT